MSAVTVQHDDARRKAVARAKAEWDAERARLSVAAPYWPMPAWSRAPAWRRRPYLMGWTQA